MNQEIIELKEANEQLLKEVDFQKKEVERIQGLWVNLWQEVNGMVLEYMTQCVKLKARVEQLEKAAEGKEEGLRYG